jgi:hypothetical protein
MAGDVELQGHTLSPIFGFDGERYAFCSCSDEERFVGVSLAEVEDAHRQHCDRVHEALVAPVRRAAARRGLEKARAGLAETLARKAAAS